MLARFPASCHDVPRRPTRLECRGFTMIELLVTMSIVAILAALLLSAVQAAREAARRVQCSSQLRQHGLALQNHLSTFSSFPGNGGYTLESRVQAIDGSEVVISTYDSGLDMLFKWGVGRPGTKPRQQPGSWAYAILPYLEQQNAYESVEFRTIQPGFLCPSRARPDSRPTADDAYGSYESGGWAWAKTDYAANLRMIPNRPRVLSAAEITDGLSHTIALGEKAFDHQVHTATTWYWDEPIFSGGSQGTGRDGSALVPDGNRYEFKTNWGAAHGGVHFVHADGSVHFRSLHSDWRVMEALLTPSGSD